MHIHIGLEELMVAAPLSFGVEQCKVRAPQECLGFRTVIGVPTDTHTHRDTQVLMLDAMGCAQSRDYLVGTQGGVFAVSHFREQYHEFIPTNG
jgi:hypothetical protein